MKIYFRVMKGRKGFYSRVIRWYTRSEYTHAEFAWPLEHPLPASWLGAQTKDGVQIRPWDYLGDEKFDLFSVEVDIFQRMRLVEFLEKQVGKPYDFLAILRMGLPDLPDELEKAERWFCSELVFYALRSVGVTLLRVPLQGADRITPRDIATSPAAVLVTSG